MLRPQMAARKRAAASGNKQLPATCLLQSKPADSYRRLRSAGIKFCRYKGRRAAPKPQPADESSGLVKRDSRLHAD